MTDQQPLIFLVDDDMDYLEINRHILESVDFRVITFLDPEDAIDYLDKERPDLVVSDLMMKSLDSGFIFARQLKEKLQSVPIILLTAVGSRRGFNFKPKSENDLSSMNIDAFFDKSVDSGTLIAKVRELLNRRGGVMS